MREARPDIGPGASYDLHGKRGAFGTLDTSGDSGWCAVVRRWGVATRGLYCIGLYFLLRCVDATRFMMMEAPCHCSALFWADGLMIDSACEGVMPVGRGNHGPKLARKAHKLAYGIVWDALSKGCCQSDMDMRTACT